MTFPPGKPLHGPGSFGKGVPLIGAQKFVHFRTHYVCDRCKVKYTLPNILPEKMCNGLTEFIVIGLCVKCAKALSKLPEKKPKDD